MNSLTNKVCVISGATSGIGYEAALQFAKLGAELILINRDQEKAQNVKSQIVAQTGNNKIHLYHADFSCLEDVRRAAHKIRQRFLQIHILANNAGGSSNRHQVTQEGFERTFAVNHLSSFLLTQLLLEPLRKSGNARVIFTSSIAHKLYPIDFNDLNLNHSYSELRAYAISKLMNLLTAKEFSRRLKQAPITFSCFHPGGVRTGIWHKSGWYGKVIIFLCGLFFISPQKGADTLIWLATSNDEEAQNADGDYFFKRKKRKVAKQATQDAARVLWEISQKLTSSAATIHDTTPTTEFDS